MDSKNINGEVMKLNLIKRFFKWLTHYTEFKYRTEQGMVYTEEDSIIKNHGEPYSKSDEMNITELTKAGYNDDFIANKLGRTKRAIQQKRCELRK